MFEPENRVCPNCGANSFTNGICDFCGAKVFVSSDGVIPVQHQEESKNSVIVRTYGQFSDVYITKVRTCYYKRNCMYFTDSKNNRRELWFGYREEKDIITIFFTFHNEGSTTIDTGDCQFRLDSEELSRTNLERICRAKELNVLFTDSKIRNADIIILLAQAFYYHIFNKYTYVDAEDKLYQRFNLMIIDNQLDNEGKIHKKRQKPNVSDTNKDDEGCFLTKVYKSPADIYITQVRTHYRNKDCMTFRDSRNHKKILRFDCVETKDNQTLTFKFYDEDIAIIDIGDCQFRLDSKELSRTNLERMCKAKKVKVLFRNSIIKNADIIILLAQAFYNRIFDKSAYLDAEGKLCQLFNTKDTIDTQNKNPEIEKTKGNRGLKKSEKKEKEDWKKAKERENFQSCLLVLLIVGGLAILSIVASHIFKPVGW